MGTPATTSLTREEKEGKTSHRVLLSLLTERPRGRLLDIPSGSGEVARRLAARGFAVSCADLYPEQFIPGRDDLRCARVDLNERLPYADESFDYVLCVESLQYLENSHHVIREFARVLCPGGELLLSLLNTLNIQSRISLLLKGYGDFFKPVRSPGTRDGQLPWQSSVAYINPLSPADLFCILEAAGFGGIVFLPGRTKPRMIGFLPIVLLVKLVAAADLLFQGDPRRRQFRRLLASRTILLSETLVATARKSRPDRARMGGVIRREGDR